MDVKAIEAHQIEDAKNVIATVVQEIWGISREQHSSYDTLGDIDNVQQHYLNNKGVFLVLLDGERVVGTGAVRRLDDEVCELKRMWLLKPYRGRGFGQQMAQMLFDFAKGQGYRLMRLDMGGEEKQAQAYRFYLRCGFYEIGRYNDGPCQIFMEKKLQESDTRDNEACA